MLDTINYLNYDEFMVGENHPTLTDTLNRPIKELVQMLQDGSVDGSVNFITIKIASSTDIDVSVASDDIVYFNEATSKYEKAFDEKALGVIDIENLIIYVFGLYTFKTITGLITNKQYYIDGTNPGALVDEYDVNKVGNVIGLALSANSMLVKSAGGGSGSGLPDVSTAAYNEITNDGIDSFWSPIRVNPNSITSDYTLPAGANGQVAGPFGIEDGIILTVEDGAVFVVN